MHCALSIAENIHSASIASLSFPRLFQRHHKISYRLHSFRRLNWSQGRGFDHRYVVVGILLSASPRLTINWLQSFPFRMIIFLHLIFFDNNLANWPNGTFSSEGSCCTTLLHKQINQILYHFPRPIQMGHALTLLLSSGNPAFLRHFLMVFGQTLSQALAAMNVASFRSIVLIGLYSSTYCYGLRIMVER